MTSASFVVGWENDLGLEVVGMVNCVVGCWLGGFGGGRLVEVNGFWLWSLVHVVCYWLGGFRGNCWL